MTDADKNAAARRLFSGPCRFVTAAADAAQFPKEGLPEIAFAGRSNVGKSSLVNALAGRKDLARASNTPGRTQQIVFFDFGGRLMLADMPGYGHAKAPRAEREKWQALAENYLSSRRNLECVLLLLDGRHGAKPADLEAMKLLDRAAVSYQAVLTKGDEVRGEARAAQEEAVAALLAQHGAARPGFLWTSARRHEGLEELRAFIAGFAKG